MASQLGYPSEAADDKILMAFRGPAQQNLQGASSSAFTFGGVAISTAAFSKEEDAALLKKVGGENRVTIEVNPSGARGGNDGREYESQDGKKICWGLGDLPSNYVAKHITNSVPRPMVPR